MYFENTWKSADNYTCVGFSVFDASHHQFFHAEKDESYFHIKHKTWVGKGRWERNIFCGFLVTFIGSINFIPVTEGFHWQPR